MPGQREDYLLKQTELLRQFVARLMRDRDPIGIEEALRLAFSLQEKIFPEEPQKFLRLEIADQVAALRQNETPGAGEAKCLAYAELLRETATLYELRGRDDLAFGARQLALQVLLLVFLDRPLDRPTLHRQIHELRESLSAEILHPPVAELLADYDARES